MDNHHYEVVLCDDANDTTLDALAATRRSRSTVRCRDTKQIYAVSPNKSIPFDWFQQWHLDMMLPDLSAGYILNETVEGTMINLFYDWNLNRWEIATRSVVGGNYWFYRTNYAEEDATAEPETQETFLQMTLDALHIQETPYQPWYTHPLMRALSKTHSYSFVLQHPKNHIVYTHITPRLYLVGVYHIQPNSTQTGWMEQDVYPVSPYSEMVRTLFLPWLDAGVFYLPERYDVTDLFTQLNEMYAHNYPMGLMITHIETGHRCKIENPRYVKLKELRGNNPNLHYHFFELLQAGQFKKTKEFVDAFPQYCDLFGRFFGQYLDFLHILHNAYIQYYVRKSRDVIPKHIFVHVAKIHHTYYVTQTAEMPRQRVTFDTIQKYFETLTPSTALWTVSQTVAQ